MTVKVWAASKGEIPWTLFKPQQPSDNTEGDIDGLSVSRDSLTTPEQASVKPDGSLCHVVRVNVSVALANKLTVKPDPIPRDPGHCLIPELNHPDYAENKKKKAGIRAAAQDLAANAEVALLLPGFDSLSDP